MDVYANAYFLYETDKATESEHKFVVLWTEDFKNIFFYFAFLA